MRPFTQISWKSCLSAVVAPVAGVTARGGFSLYQNDQRNVDPRLDVGGAFVRRSGDQAEGKMAKHLGKAITAAAGIGILAVSAAVALASIPEHITLDGATTDAVPHADAATLPAPVSGVPLFVADASGHVPACVTAAEVIRQLDADRDRFGGETVRLERGLDQAFADEWRRDTGSKPVTVSAVFGHVFGADDTMVDVIEIDARGCALSRTLLSGDDFELLLARASGLEA